MRDFEEIHSEPKKAVIYCRVSSKKQTSDGSGLDSQEYRCRQYAELRGYEVEAVFPDDVSGGGDFMNRPGMVALLHYLDAQPDKRYAVIFDDLKRLARDRDFHFKLRDAFRQRHATVECLNFTFDESPEGEFVETVFAAQGQLERKQNARQVRQKMQARLESGYWVFHAPVGYRYVKSSDGGKVLVRDEPLATIVQEALEGFATGRFATQVEVKRYLDARSEFPKDRTTGEVHPQKVARLLTQHLYAGYIKAQLWNVSLRKGKHEGLIGLETFERIQQRMNEGVYAPARKDIREDFPLRGAVCCSECDTPLTAGWSKGKNKKYPYYFCREKGCSLYGKTIARKKIEGEFENLLSGLQPTRGLVEIAAAMFRDFWNMQLEQAASRVEAVKRDALDAENKIEQLIDAVVEATNPRVIAAYERRIEALEQQKLILAEKERELGATPKGFDNLFEHSIRFLSSPYKLWQTGRFEMQRLVLKLVFSEHLAYSRNEGFRTPKTTLPFSMLGGFDGQKVEMVPTV